jgi:hypothetical protein
MAAIEQLLKATPARQDGVDGYALEWKSHQPYQPYPSWLSSDALTELWTLLPSDLRAFIDRAKDVA